MSGRSRCTTYEINRFFVTGIIEREPIISSSRFCPRLIIFSVLIVAGRGRCVLALVVNGQWKRYDLLYNVVSKYMYVKGRCGERATC